MTFFAVEYVYDSTRPDELDRIRPEHRAFLGSLKDQGVNIASGPLAGDRPRALLILIGEDEAHIAATLDEDPFFTSGLIVERQIHRWDPVIRAF
ncbi:hypothetical protein G7Y41_05035 [Schaalia sp. ZJ405]|uniref:YciI family protein n=1 Tax=Schaalia sp. ZJ405 TaxID=2709403 RepID=UPI0013E9E3A6|nr:YciI family protein [Schaalia sp. ZJ405]QPK80487.1 hypothetical protein G7Y41_05035 [Schaalia sp. ZJ405]